MKTATTTKQHIQINSLQCHGMLWQAIADKTCVLVHANLDKSVCCNLICGDYVIATVRIAFRTYKSRNAAIVRAEQTGCFEVMEGESKIVK